MIKNTENSKISYYKWSVLWRTLFKFTLFKENVVISNVILH